MLRILLSAQFGIGGSKHRMRKQLSIAPRITRKPANASINRVGVSAKQVIRQPTQRAACRNPYRYRESVMNHGRSRESNPNEA